MPIAALIGSALTWLFREVMFKFVILTAASILIAMLWPLVKTFIAPFIDFSSLNGLLGGLPSGVWYFLALARLDVGLPLMIGAHVTRFIVRRIPFVG